jgi:hypothetical protein
MVAVERLRVPLNVSVDFCTIAISCSSIFRFSRTPPKLLKIEAAEKNNYTFAHAKELAVRSGKQPSTFKSEQLATIQLAIEQTHNYRRNCVATE